MLVNPFASPVYPARSVLINTEAHFLEVLKLGPGMAAAGMYLSELAPRSVTCPTGLQPRHGTQLVNVGELSCHTSTS